MYNYCYIANSPIWIACKFVSSFLAGESKVLALVMEHSDVRVGREEEAIVDCEHVATVTLYTRKGMVSNYQSSVEQLVLFVSYIHSTLMQAFTI